MTDSPVKTKFLSGSLALSALIMLFSCGCASSYNWTCSVPEDMRTVSVPTFRNESELMEIGSLMTRQVLREFQREGSFAVKRAGSAALEIQGVVKSVSSSVAAYDRRTRLRLSGYTYKVRVEVSVIDKKNAKVLVDNRLYTAETSYAANQDMTNAQRDASARAAEDLARQVVDDVLAMKW